MTTAQKLNKAYYKIWDEHLRIEQARKDILPSCNDYKHYLDKIVSRDKISIDNARYLYGQFTYGQWKVLLGV